MADGRQNRRHLSANDQGLYEAALKGDLLNRMEMNTPNEMI